MRKSRLNKLAYGCLRKTFVAGLIVTAGEASFAETPAGGGDAFSTTKLSQTELIFGRPEQPVTPGYIGPQPVFEGQSVTGGLHVEGINYFRDIPENPSLSRSQFMSAQVVAQGLALDTFGTTYKADAGAETFFSVAESDYIVHEAEVTAHLSPYLSVSAGRKKEPWSEMDHVWQLGLWQPQFAIDTLRPEEEGLTGFFVDWTPSKDFELIAFGTPLFIPTTGPNVREENGSLVSDSRWYRTPSSNFNFSGTTYQVKYQLNVPDISSLVENEGHALYMRVGQKDSGFWGDAAIGRKPVNNLLLQRLIVSPVIGPGGEHLIDATVVPVVGYHQLISADIGYAFPQVRTSLSFISDDPEVIKPNDLYVIQKLNPLKAYSAQADWQTELFHRAVLAQIGYLKVNGGDIVDIRSHGEPDDFTLFNSQLMFSDASSAAVQGELGRLWNKPLLGKFRYLYDFDQRGSMISTEFQLLPSRRWAVVLGLDVLGVDDESYKPDSFLNQYRANDRMYGGMSYVF